MAILRRFLPCQVPLGCAVYCIWGFTERLGRYLRHGRSCGQRRYGRIFLRNANRGPCKERLWEFTALLVPLA